METKPESQTSIEIEMKEEEERKGEEQPIPIPIPIPIPNRFRYIIGLFLFDFPFLFCNFYFAFASNESQTSCIHIIPQKNAIDIYTYLIVEGIVGTMRLFSSSYSIMKFNTLGICIPAYYVSQVFNVIWSIVGGYTFYQPQVSSKCSHPIYLYMNVFLMFNFIIGFLLYCSVESRSS
jgi:hypothetical protein